MVLLHGAVPLPPTTAAAAAEAAAAAVLFHWTQVLRKSAPTRPQTPLGIIRGISSIKAHSVRSGLLRFILKTPQEINYSTIVGLDSKKTQVTRLSLDRPHLS